MFIITQNNILENKIKIVDIVEEEGAYIEAFDILMNDCLKFSNGHSIKIIDKYKVEIKEINYFSSPIKYIYEIHPFNEPELIFKKNKD